MGESQLESTSGRSTQYKQFVQKYQARSYMRIAYDLICTYLH